MKLNTLRNGSLKSKKRVGRGIGSGRGKTSSRGIKGQKSRSGSAINSFEGGQQSIITSLPKRGFRPYYGRNKLRQQCFNVNHIQKLCDVGKIKSGDVVDNHLFLSLRLIKSSSEKVKILGDGKLSVSLIFRVFAISSNAKEIIEKAGGVIQEVVL